MLRSGESCHGFPPRNGEGRRSSVIGERRLGNRGTSERSVELRVEEKR